MQLLALRRVVLAAAPADVDEVLCYGVPTLQIGGKSLTYFGAAKKHVALYGSIATVLDEFRAELDALALPATKGTIKFSLDDVLPADLIARIVRRRVAEFEAKRTKKV